MGLLNFLQKTSYRVPILKALLRLDTFWHHWITFFAMEGGLHPKHRLTKYHDFFTATVSAHDTILDVGCGLGLLSVDLSRHAKSVDGIDIDERSITFAREHSKDLLNCHFILGDATIYDLRGNYDYIALSNVLEHIDDRVAFLIKLKKLGKTFLIRVPMIDRDWLTPLKKELGLPYLLDPTHRIEYTEKLFRDELSQAGLTPIQLEIRFGEIYCVANRID